MCGSCVAMHVWQLTCMLLLYGEGEPSCVAHMWRLTCTLLLYGGGEPSCMAHMHGNYCAHYYYMVEGSPHLWFMCGN